MRSLFFIVMLILLTGCIPAFQNSSTNTTTTVEKPDTDQLTVGLNKLEKSGDPAALEALIKADPDSTSAASARSILNIRAAQNKLIAKLKKENAELVKEKQTLQNNLEQLNQINLELEKRVQ
ncbi:MAG: hypothetical protein C0615_10260 [Desulfuromonas sp.]|nr:MAG: hypothetical protein C0615_10260 [Desulfuromonas sp.]